MRTTVLVSSKNGIKIDRVSRVFTCTPFKIKSLCDIQVTGKAIENGDSLEENVVKKIMFAREHFVPRDDEDVWFMADCRALYIDALDGMPGTMSDTWAGPNSWERDNTVHCLKMLAGYKNRRAYFKTMLILANQRDDYIIFSNECFGRLLEYPKTLPQRLNPYADIFEPDGSRKVLGELTAEEDWIISTHRKTLAKALLFLYEIHYNKD